MKEVGEKNNEEREIKAGYWIEYNTDSTSIIFAVLFMNKLIMNKQSPSLSGLPNGTSFGNKMCTEAKGKQETNMFYPVWNCDMNYTWCLAI